MGDWRYEDDSELPHDEGRWGTWRRPPLTRGTFVGPAGYLGTPDFGRGYERTPFHARGPYPNRGGELPRQPDFRGVGPKNWKPSDERIREQVCDWLTDHPLIDASDVDVKVEDAVVTLTGTVDGRRMKRFCSDLVEDLPYVRDVMNVLRLRRREVVGPRAERGNGEERPPTRSGG